MPRRVVITGIGAISPNGVGRECFWTATRNGRSGVRRISRFDASGFQVQVARTGPGNRVWFYSPRGTAPTGSTVTIFVGLLGF